uniref:(California timema) hypothetical protein n=1 Tax=Timema californicum TaxID=61474 RepID=A0A7R9JFP0_TIMCA|nr:unnamed protein product [Timema californicum]
MKSPEAMASGRGVINLRFNQDQGCFSCCMETGLRIYNVDPLVEKAHFAIPFACARCPKPVCLLIFAEMYHFAGLSFENAPSPEAMVTGKVRKIKQSLTNALVVLSSTAEDEGSRFESRSGMELMGSVGYCEMLYRTNLLAIVAGGARPKFADNTVLVYDDISKKFVLEFTFSSFVKNVKLRRDK